MSLKPIIPPGLYNQTISGGSAYDPANVAITGGTINGTAIGGTTPAAGAFTTLNVSSALTLGASGILVGGTNLIEQRNGVNAQSFNIYKTFTDASNYEYFGFTYDSVFTNSYVLSSYALGTGQLRPFGLYGSVLEFGTAGVGPRWRIDANGHFLAATDNTYDIGASGANRPRDIFVGRNLQLGNAATTGLIAGALAALTTASIVIYDSTGTAYRVPCVTP